MLERADRRRDVLGEGAAVAPLVALDGLTEHLVSRAEPGHRLAHGLDRARHVGAGNRVSGSAQAGAHESQDVRNAVQHVPDVRMHRRRAHAHDYRAGPGLRRIDLREPEDLG